MTQIIKTNIAILPQYSCNNIVSPLQAFLAKNEIQSTIELGTYQNANQDLLSNDSWLFSKKPDFVLIPLSSRALFPHLFNELTSPSFSVESALVPLTQILASLTKTALTSTFIISTLEPARGSPFGFRDIISQNGAFSLIEKANALILAAAKENPNLVVYDFSSTVSRIGAATITDEKMWHLGKILLTTLAASAVANDIGAIICARYGKTRKCLVVDLDNTLWGGIIGEDGISNLELSNSKIGDIYTHIQETLLSFKRQGTLLAICSKNNEQDVLPIFSDPRMILKQSDFAAMRINWQLKSLNIASIAKELNIGVDSLAFLDDNPAERLEVSSVHPSVFVIDFPKDVAKLPQLLEELTCFTTAIMTKEDLARAQMYQDDKARKALESTAGSLGDYLSSLETRIEVKKNDEDSLARITQLINKTNQFNLRTQRYTDAQVKSFMESSKSMVVSVQVFDKFGDIGLTGVAILSEKTKTEWFIDSLLLSCRILGRDIELQFFQELLNYLPNSVTSLSAEFIATSKNSQVEMFYDKLGFTCQSNTRKSEVTIKKYVALIKSIKKSPLSWIKVERN